MLTSSAADELALESREIRGSFFTHHLVSGLRGAADTSGDGRVTLAEAYQYAFDHTLSATASTGAVPSAQVASKGPMDTPEVEGLESLSPEARVEFEGNICSSEISSSSGPRDTLRR